MCRRHRLQSRALAEAKPFQGLLTKLLCRPAFQYVVQEEPGDATDPEMLGLLASIGIANGYSAQTNF
jgi:hypothetical protein